MCCHQLPWYKPPPAFYWTPNHKAFRRLHSASLLCEGPDCKCFRLVGLCVTPLKYLLMVPKQQEAVVKGSGMAMSLCLWEQTTGWVHADNLCEHRIHTQISGVISPALRMHPNPPDLPTSGPFRPQPFYPLSWGLDQTHQFPTQGLYTNHPELPLPCYHGQLLPWHSWERNFPLSLVSLQVKMWSRTSLRCLLFSVSTFIRNVLVVNGLFCAVVCVWIGLWTEGKAAVVSHLPGLLPARHTGQISQSTFGREKTSALPAKPEHHLKLTIFKGSWKLSRHIRPRFTLLPLTKSCQMWLT